MTEVSRGSSFYSSSDDDDDDDEEDRSDLLPRDQTRPPTATTSTSNSRSFFFPFDIDHKYSSSLLRRRFSSFDLRTLGDRKRYFLCGLVPLLVFLLYFSVDLGGLFRSSNIWDVNFVGSSTPFSSDHHRETQLRALYLLREQHLGLVSLFTAIGFNHTVNRNHIDQDIRDKIFDQILINNQIQKLLLSTHHTENLYISAPDADFRYFCGAKMKRHLPNRIRTIQWVPTSDKYLFAICVSGQMSNHLICLEKHMFFAALLKRLLVIPSPKVDYHYSRVLDIEHINQCLGRKVVITFEEFYHKKKKKKKKKGMKIDKFICYFPNCYMDEDHVRKLKKHLGLSLLPKLETPWTDDVSNPKETTVQGFLSKFTSDDEVIAIGDVFFANVEREWVMQPGGPIAHKCKTLIEPSRLILLTAQRFIQTFLGKDYVALHFRRHGFLNFCNVKNTSCFFPVSQAADCITSVVRRANTPVIYLSTDAAESETGLLQSLMVVDGKPIPLVKRPPRNLAEKWDALLYRHGLADDSQVEAMLDKTICAMSRVFVGSSGSTFTEDILRLRKDWGTASGCDEYICQAQIPNFIADVD